MAAALSAKRPSERPSQPGHFSLSYEVKFVRLGPVTSTAIRQILGVRIWENSPKIVGERDLEGEHASHGRGLPQRYLPCGQTAGTLLRQLGHVPRGNADGPQVLEAEVPLRAEGKAPRAGHLSGGLAGCSPSSSRQGARVPQ